MYPYLLPEYVVNCFKMCIFAVASTICIEHIRVDDMLWIASKCVSLQWQAQLLRGETFYTHRCELLQNVYLCSGKHNWPFSSHTIPLVVNCFKMCIFAVASTIQEQLLSPCFLLWIASKCVSLQWQAQYNCYGVAEDNCCELLQNVYLCSGKHNRLTDENRERVVVNCFKMCIFAVASTILRLSHPMMSQLWIASKCVSLQWQAQSSDITIKTDDGCELLQNVYLCSGKHNPLARLWRIVEVVNCFKMCIFAVASTIPAWYPGRTARLWIASKCVSLQWQAQSMSLRFATLTSCELLQNVYLCSGKHNTSGSRYSSTSCCELLQNVYLCSSKHNGSCQQIQQGRVVNCFKMCIFAVASTIVCWRKQPNISCELLQNVYLCSSKHNCLIVIESVLELWIASKCVSLQ